MLQPSRFFLISLVVSIFTTAALYADDFDQMRNVNTVAAAEALMKKGVNVRAKSTGGWTWLHLAANNGNVELVKFLIEKGLEVDARDADQYTPIMHAVRFPKVMEFLISKGADVNAGDKHKKTMLHGLAYAPAGGADAAIELLLKKGARLDLPDDAGTLPVGSACSANNVERVKMMLALGKFDLETKDRNQRTLLHNCVSSEHVPMIQFLISKGARVDAKDADGQTPLASLIRVQGTGNKLAAIQALLVGRSNPNAQDNEGRTALHEGVMTKTPEIVKALVAGGGDPDIANKKGVTPLTQAVINEDYPVVKILIKTTKKLNALDKYGATMLHDAVINHRVEMIRVLLEAGADRSAKNKFGKTPLETARYDNVPEIIQLLEAGR